MKSLLVVGAMLALGGCAVAPAPYYARTAQPAYDPYQWHVVSSDPIPSGQGSTYVTTQGYSSAPVYVDQPVYVTQPAYYYAPQPAYYYPPISIGLDFGFGRWYGGGRGRGWGGGGFHGRGH